MAVLFIPSIATAQQSQQKIELGTIVVEGDQNQENGNEGGPAQAAETGTGPINGYVATKTTTGSKTDTPITEIPQSVSVIGRDEIDDRKALKVDEALAYTAGVAAQPFGTDADTDWFFIRGFQATQTGVYLDGLSLPAYSFGGFVIDPFLLERVEVLKGPASVLYGGSNPGGIVSLISKRPTGDNFGYVEAGVNNWGNAYVAGDFGGVSGEDDKWSYRVTSRIAGGGYQTDFTEDLRGAVLPQITYQPDDTTRLTAYAQYFALDEEGNAAGFLPYEGTVIKAPFGKIDRDFFPGEPDADDLKHRQFMVGYEFEHTFDNDWTVTQNARFGRLTDERSGPFGSGYRNPDPDPAVADYNLKRTGFEADTEVDSFLVDNRINGTVLTGAVEHNLLFGIDYKYFNIERVEACCGTVLDIDPTNPVYGTPVGPNTLVYADDIRTQNQIGLYAQDQLRFGGGWLVTLNLRNDWVLTDFDNNLTGSSATPSFEKDDQALSGRVGLAYEFDNGLTPYVSAATFFNPVLDANGVGGSPFEPEDGHQFEGGFKYSPTFVDALITASVFHIVKNNAVISTPQPWALASSLDRLHRPDSSLRAR